MTNKPKGQKLTSAYYANHFIVEQLENILDSYNLSVAKHRRTKIKESDYRFTVQNIKNNAEHQLSCCHKPPTGENNGLRI